MLNSTVRVLTIACSLMVIVLAVPATSTAGIFGCHSCAAPVVVAPACATCAPPTVTYMPTVVRRALYQPAVVAAYQPVASYGAAYTTAYTTYRPVFGGWGYRAPLVPYTAYYQPAYYMAMPVATYSGCSSCVSYSSCSSPCDGGACGSVSYETPTAGCASCAAPATVVAPAPVSSNQAPPRTFQEKTEKPVTEPEIKPIPRNDTQLNSMPMPVLPDPQDRTASRSDYSTARVRLVASPVQASPAQENDGWQPARD